MVCFQCLQIFTSKVYAIMFACFTEVKLFVIELRISFLFVLGGAKKKTDHS
jgi:hypothetical protein